MIENVFLHAQNDDLNVCFSECLVEIQWALNEMPILTKVIWWNFNNESDINVIVGNQTKYSQCRNSHLISWNRTQFETHCTLHNGNTNSNSLNQYRICKCVRLPPDFATTVCVQFICSLVRCPLSFTPTFRNAFYFFFRLLTNLPLLSAFERQPYISLALCTCISHITLNNTLIL